MEHLPGGSGGVWRDDDPEHGPEVHRPTGPWTPAVHDLLAHLENAGLDGVPRVLGFDADGREVLTYLPAAPWPSTPRPPRMTRSREPRGGCAASTTPCARTIPGRRIWRQTAAPLEPGQLICHNDTGAYNWIVDGGRFVGMIDWDQAGPGLPLDDLAFLCWSGVPLFREIPAADAARRVALAAEAYGGVDPADLLDAVADRMRRASDRIAAGIGAAIPGCCRSSDLGEPERTREPASTRLQRPDAGAARGRSEGDDV